MRRVKQNCEINHWSIYKASTSAVKEFKSITLQVLKELTRLVTGLSALNSKFVKFMIIMIIYSMLRKENWSHQIVQMLKRKIFSPQSLEISRQITGTFTTLLFFQLELHDSG